MSCNHGILEQRFSLAFRNFFKMPAGFVVDTHAHNYNHVMELYYGEVRIEATRGDGTKIDDTHRTVDGVPVRIEIVKGIEHKFTVTMDGTSLSCAFSHRFYDGSEADKFEGSVQAYN